MARVDYAPQPPYVDASGRYAYVSVAGRHEYGEPDAQAFARRLRDDVIPAVAFPARRRPCSRAAGRPRARLHRQRVRGLPVARSRRPRAHVHHLAACLPLAPAPSEGGAAEPARDRGDVRAARDRLQVRRRCGPARPVPVRPGRGMDPDLPVRDALRPLDGLRGLPRLADAGVLGRGSRTRRRSRRVSSARAHRHGGGDRDGRGLRGLRGRVDRRPAGVRYRARVRDLHRRDPRARAARAGADAALRPLQLVAARERCRLVRVAPSPLSAR